MNLSDTHNKNAESNDNIRSCCKVTSHKIVSTSKFKIIKNLIVVSTAFLFLYCAVNALAALQSTLNSIGNIGVISQSLIYAASIISSLLLPKLVIKKLGCKLTLVISVLSHVPYIAANVYPEAWLFFPASVLLGAGIGTMWCSAHKYVNHLSFLYSDGDVDKAKLSTPIFFGIFNMFAQTTLICGNMISFFVLRPSDSNPLYNFSLSKNVFNTSTTSCGAEFCGKASEILLPPPEEQVFILIAIYFAFAIFSAVVAFFFLDKLEKKHDIEKTEDSLIMNLLATFNQLKNVDQRLLVILTTYTGQSSGFLFADFTQAYIACAMGLQNVAFILMGHGIVFAIVSFLGGYIVKYVPRAVLMTVAVACRLGLHIVLFAWIPNSKQFWIFFVVISFWGFSDGIFHTQINAFYGVFFRENDEAAFANYRLWRSFGFMISYGCSSLLCTVAKNCILVVFLLVGYIGYIIVEFRIFFKQKFYVV